MPNAEVEQAALESRPRSGAGSAMGILVFIFGILLLLLTFRLAYGMFTVEPEVALGIKPNQPIDLGSSVQQFGWVVVRVLLLIVMAVVGSLVANRGIKLYTDSVLK